MPASENALTLTRLAAEAASDGLARDIVALDVSDHLVITDAFLLCSAPSERQVRAIVDLIEEKLRVQRDTRPARREGEREGRWVLLDYLDLVVHVQHTDEREYYQLERLWRDCPVIELPDTVTEGQRAPARGPDGDRAPDSGPGTGSRFGEDSGGDTGTDPLPETAGGSGRDDDAAEDDDLEWVTAYEAEPGADPRAQL